MHIALGPGVDQRTASTHIENLERRLPDGEVLRYLGAAHPHMGHDFHVVTNHRVLCVSSRNEYAVTDDLPLDNVATAYVAQDRDDHVVHIPLKDGEHFLLRPHNGVDGAGNLARAIGSASAAIKDPDSGQQPLTPEDRPGPTLLDETGIDYLHIVIPRDEVEEGRTEPTLTVLAPLIQSRQSARTFLERVTIQFDGYNDTTAELFEITEVRNYVQQLDGRFPYWLYFLDKRTSSFDVIWRCFMPPSLTPQGQAEHFPRHLDPLLRNWWTPAMDAICGFVDMTEQEYNDLCERYALYFQGKRDF